MNDFQTLLSRFSKEGFNQKTVYGEVAYHRAVYKAIEADSHKHCAYLLAERLEFDSKRLISTNIVELPLKRIMGLSCQGRVSKASKMT